jgi:hypothetical protein
VARFTRLSAMRRRIASRTPGSSGTSLRPLRLLVRCRMVSISASVTAAAAAATSVAGGGGVRTRALRGGPPRGAAGGADAAPAPPPGPGLPEDAMPAADAAPRPPAGRGAWRAGPGTPDGRALRPAANLFSTPAMPRVR